MEIVRKLDEIWERGRKSSLKVIIQKSSKKKAHEIPRRVGMHANRNTMGPSEKNDVSLQTVLHMRFTHFLS